MDDMQTAEGVDIAEDAESVDGAAGRYNTRLRTRMLDRGVTYKDLAEISKCDIKTAQRWVYEGRLPRPDRAALVAQYLDIDVNWLWPRVRRVLNPELINLYTHIAEVPRTVWTTAARHACHAIEIVADAVPALPDYLEEILAAKAAQGVRVRLCVSPLAASSLVVKGVSVRVNVNEIPLGLYRFDGQMLVWLYRSGLGVERGSPALHLRRSEEDGVFEFYRVMFARLWEDGDTVLTNGSDWFRPGPWI